MSRLAALALAAALALGLVGCDTSSIVPGGSGDVMPNPAASQTGTTPSDGQDAAFQMHFIDVGQALSVLVECDGQFMLYDGGNVDDGSLVVSYLQSQGVEQLEYVFCSHAHEDHVGGLAAALAYFPACHVYSPVTEASTKCFKDFVKYTQQQNLQVEVPAAGTQWALGSATVTMLGPVAQYDDTNDTSIVLRIDYGATSFLLTGDMESDAERDLVNSGANLKVDVLQVGHHGSSTSTSYVFLNAVLPEMGIISCGVNNKYGHPHEETLSILRDAGVDVYRTDLLGTITVSSDGRNYTVATEHFATDAELNPTAPAASSTAQQAYIGNVNSKKFHLPSCANLPAEKNQILFSSYDEAVAAGYSPCSSCIKLDDRSVWLSPDKAGRSGQSKKHHVSNRSLVLFVRRFSSDIKLPAGSTQDASGGEKLGGGWKIICWRSRRCAPRCGSDPPEWSFPWAGSCCRSWR